MNRVGNTKQLNYYRLDPGVVLEQLRSGAEGLTSAEARERLEHLGPNELEHAKRELLPVTFAKQFKNTLVIMLLVAAGIALYLHDRKTTIILVIISLVNALVGFFQEYKAENLLQSLEKLVVPRAKALRDGRLEDIASTELVLGDVVYIEEGDSVPADLRILDEDELSTNDFALTGESNPTRKFVHAMSGEALLANRHNLLFMGTTVATGRGHAVVIGTGMNTELGRIANLSRSTKTDRSPLQREMGHLSKRLAQATIVLAAALTAIALHSELGLHDSLLFAVGIAAAMIPTTLGTEVSVTLAQSAGRLARARALVKKLSAVETLGATNIIATDKTGTLTKNEMTVQQLLIGKTLYHVTGTGYRPKGAIFRTTSTNQSPALRKGPSFAHLGAGRQKMSRKELKELELVFATMVLASNARISPTDKDHADWYCLGDPTEGALITLAKKVGIDTDKLMESSHELKEYQFDSARKRMSSARIWGKQRMLFVKGAPESVLELSNDIWDHGHIRPLSAKDRRAFSTYSETEANNARRNLALAYRIMPASIDPKKVKAEALEKDLTFLGIVSMIDPLREAVPAAMRAAHGAGIKVSIVTGDAPATAAAIAAQAGLAGPGQTLTTVLGSELAQLADTQVLQLLERGGTVFSRAAPEDKLRLVNLAKAHGNVIAVTGDGINDAPALKRADIGVAMGRTGTDVAKQAAGIVLLDDSFHTLIGAIEQGRLTFANIKKAARCAMTDDASELVAVLLGLAGHVLLHIPIAITAIQVLAIDIIAQLFPITALGWDKAERNLMHQTPRNLHDHIVNRRSAMEFAGYGLLAAGLAYANFLFFFARHGTSATHVSVANPLYPSATILTYLTIVLCQFTNILLVRSSEAAHFWTRYLLSNKKLLVAFCFSFFCILNIVYNPVVRPYFGAGPLGAVDWLLAIAAAGIYLIIRLFQRHTSKHSRQAIIKLHGQVMNPVKAT